MSDLLLFSYAFPPMQVQMAPVVARSMAGLAQLGYQTDVVAAEAFGPHLPQDSSLLPYVAEHFRSIHRLLPDERFITRRWRYSQAWASTPDLMGLLHRQAFEHLMDLDLRRYRAVMTWSPFHTVNTVMARVKAQRPDVKWIAQFSDPWAGNPCSKYSLTRRLWNRLRQPETIRRADYIVHSSLYSRDLMLAGEGQRALAKSAVVAGHPYEPLLYPQGEPPKGDKIVLRYVGVLYGKRSPETLFQAMQVLFEKYPAWQGKAMLSSSSAMFPRRCSKRRPRRRLPPRSWSPDRA